MAQLLFERLPIAVGHLPNQSLPVRNGHHLETQPQSWSYRDNGRHVDTKIRKTSREITFEPWSIICNLRSMNPFLPSFLEEYRNICVSQIWGMRCHFVAFHAVTWRKYVKSSWSFGSVMSIGRSSLASLQVSDVGWRNHSRRLSLLNLSYILSICSHFHPRNGQSLVRDVSKLDLCQDTGTLRQSKLTAATLESSTVTHAHAMSVQRIRKLANVIPAMCRSMWKTFKQLSVDVHVLKVFQAPSNWTGFTESRPSRRRSSHGFHSASKPHFYLGEKTLWNILPLEPHASSES